ncbi:hypothetical protein GXY_08604 [Novacetimonas hansenii ATCC 23769]|uniref:Uncharacterized protein n=1 Tax=Novacetimonas hansenii ATCC 23769 TaxID=714995 RepID=D5QF05_NOVHA|nr:hypothetical protein GXY_08604 [Novacetimonas hansenii ATCC 23769]
MFLDRWYTIDPFIVGIGIIIRSQKTFDFCEAEFFHGFNS